MEDVYFEINHRNGFTVRYMWKLKITNCYLTHGIGLPLPL